MAGILQTMLRVTRIDSRSIRLNCETVPLRGLLERIRGDYATACTRKGQTFTLSCPGDLTVRTDSQVLSEILGNLVSNAVKYTADGGSIRLEAVRAGRGVAVTVSDTGMGIPAGERANLCTKLFRASNAVASDPAGTGLGLYVAASLATLLGGTLSFVSEERKGTAFTVTLPLPPSPDGPDRPDR